LAARHLPGGPVGSPSRWDAASNVEVGKTTYPVDRGRAGMEGKERSEGPAMREWSGEGTRCF